MNLPQASTRSYITITLVAAVTAALASASALTLELPVWAMFVGWIAFFTRGLTTRSTVENLGCVWLGLIIGMLASIAIGRLTPSFGMGAALPLVVFIVALLVVGVRGLPVLNNLPGYFLGLVAWFAAHLEASFGNLAQLASAALLGSIAAWISHRIPTRFLRSVPA